VRVRRALEVVGEFLWKPASPNGFSDGPNVVVNAHEGDRLLLARFNDCVAGAPVTIFRLPD
jgi:hypothetical protein